MTQRITTLSESLRTSLKSGGIIFAITCSVEMLVLAITGHPVMSTLGRHLAWHAWSAGILALLLEGLIIVANWRLWKSTWQAQREGRHMQGATVLATFDPDGELVASVLAAALDRCSPACEAIITFGTGMTVEFQVQNSSVERWVYDEHGRSPGDGLASQPGDSATWRGAFRDLDEFRREVVSCFRTKLAEPVVPSHSGFSGRLHFPRCAETGQVIEEDLVYTLALQETTDSLVISLEAEPKKRKPQ